MSYCVNCGVELDGTAEMCPLCRTPVYNPARPVDRDGSTPFPTERGEVALDSRWEVAVLISAMLGSAALCCGLLNLFFLLTSQPWSLYVIGAAAMLWVFIVPPLLWRKLPLPAATLLDGAAVGLYVLLIAWELDGLDWYLHLALPATILLAAILLAQVLLFQKRRLSILSTMAVVIASVAVFVAGGPVFPWGVGAVLVAGGADRRRSAGNPADGGAPGSEASEGGPTAFPHMSGR